MESTTGDRTASEVVVRIDEEDQDKHSESPVVLRARVEHTRAEVKDTISNIQARLSPARLKQDVRDATVGKVEDMAQTARHTVQRWSGSAMDTVSQNPVPVALIGLGLMWLFKARSEEAHQDDLPEYSKSYGYRNPYDPSVNRESSTLEDLKLKASENQALRARVEGAAGTVQEKVGDAAQTMQDNTSEFSERMKGHAEEFSNQVQDRAGEFKDQVQRQTRRAKKGFEQTLQENPWGVGAMAFAIGAAVGLSAPGTQKEDEWMGETRDTLVDQARGKAQEMGDKVMQVAEEVQ
ncbi:MAG: hypothetical protein NPIRA04_31980 [Nitrospirales bacterium]|nr:MAG: hypothetical protein NPIRA04_31980 [Nitrospirales bacterium]